MYRVSAFFLTHVPAYPSLSFHFNNLDSKQRCSQGGFNPVKHLSGSADVRLVSSLDVNNPASHLLSVGHRQPYRNDQLGG